MPATQLCRQPGVIDRLFEAPWRFDLVQALRLIELWLRRNGVAGDGDFLRHVRFRNSLSMHFPASQIEALAVMGDAPIASGSALQAAFDAGQMPTLTITPAFLGFFGVNGMMPNFYTDDIADQIRHDKYEGTRAFFDIFYNRIMALYFQAACKHRVQHRFDEDGVAAILPMQLALAGQKAARDDDDIVSDAVVAHYAALLRHRPVSASLIESILADFFHLPIRLEQFIGAYDRLHQDERCMLGVQCATLSAGAVLGERVRECHTRARLHVGPLAIADYERFLPGGAAAAQLKQLLALFATPTIHFELHLILRAADVLPLRFDAPHGNRLGYDTCLLGTAAHDDCGEFLFDLDR
jgi:type VI secretion system protein ImpH